jgi:hypothetical protein
MHLGQRNPIEHEMEIEGVDVGPPWKRTFAAPALPIFEQSTQVWVGRQGFKPGSVLDRDIQLGLDISQAILESS